MGRRLLILGAGGHGRAVADLAQACGFTVAGFTERSGRGPDVVGTDDDLPTLTASLEVDGALIGVGNTALGRRVDLFARLRALRLATPSLVHPSAVVSPSARIGDGTVVFPQVVIGAACVIGMNAVLYSGAVIEHDCRLGDHTYLAPRATLCGQVLVHDSVFIGAGAVVVPGVTIGKGATIDALVRVAGPVAAGGRLSMTRSMETRA